MASTLNLCANCGYNNLQAVGEDYLVKDKDGNQVKNPDGTDLVKSFACARCGYAKKTLPAPEIPPTQESN